jgi:uncharacterized membrane protein YjgN (DUF898 family)
MRNTAYRNIRFHFYKDLKAAYMVFLLPLALVLLFTWLSYTLLDSFGVLDQMADDGKQSGEVFTKQDFMLSAFFLAFLPITPWLDYLRTRFIVEHTQFGKTKATFTIGGWDFYKVYLQTGLIYMGILLACAGVFYGIYKLGFSETSSAEAIGGVFFGITAFYAILIFLSGIWKAMRTNMINNNIKIGENQLYSNLKGTQVGWIYISNTILIVLSMGSLIPWAKVRMAKYTARCTEIQINDLDSIKAIEPEQGTAFGEEMDEIFDMDIGF